MASSSEADANLVSDLFAGLRFFLIRRVPLRSQLIEEIKANGGSVVPLERSATHVIADELFKDSPDGSISWKFIDDALKQKAIPDAEKYVIRTNTGAARPAGSTTVPAKRVRAEYTAEEDLEIRRYVYNETKEYDGRGQGGDAIYKEFAKDHPRHPWQSWRDRYLKFLKQLGPPPSCKATGSSTVRTTLGPVIAPDSTISAHRTAGDANIVDAADGTEPSHVPNTDRAASHADTRPGSLANEDVANEDVLPTSTAKRVRNEFTKDEDIALYNYVYSMPIDKRRGNNIYQEYARLHQRHGWHSWRDRFVRRLEMHPPTSTRTDASTEYATASSRESRPRGRAKVPFTQEDDLALWKFVQGKRDTSGNLIYDDFARTNPRHSPQSWRHRYMNKLAHNPPSGAQQQSGLLTTATSEAQPVVADTPTSAEDVGLSHAGLASTAKQDPHSTMPGQSQMSRVVVDMSTTESSILSQADQILLFAVLSRKPRDSKGAYFTQLEISHLILNMPDPMTKTLGAEQDELWEAWTTVMESRSAQDWKDLYYDHVLLEAVRLEHRNSSPKSPAHQRLSTRARESHISPPNQHGTGSSKRKAVSPASTIPSKKQKSTPDRAEADVTPPEHRSPQRSETEQLRASHERRGWLFDRAAHRRKIEQSERTSAVSSPGGRLTMANLAAQTAEMERPSPGLTPNCTMTAQQEHAAIAGVVHEHVDAAAILSQQSERRSNLPSPPGSREAVPEDEQTKDAPTQNGPLRGDEHTVPPVSALQATVVSNESSNLYDSSFPPKKPAELAETAATHGDGQMDIPEPGPQSQTWSQEAESYEIDMGMPLPPSSLARTSPVHDSHEIEIDMGMPLPPSSLARTSPAHESNETHDDMSPSMRKETYDLGLSMLSPPGSAVSSPTRRKRESSQLFVNPALQDVDEHVDPSEHLSEHSEDSRERDRDTTSQALDAKVGRTPFHRPHEGGPTKARVPVDTQAILEQGTYTLDVNIAEPAPFTSSPPADQLSSAHRRPPHSYQPHQHIETWVAETSQSDGTHIAGDDTTNLVLPNLDVSPERYNRRGRSQDEVPEAVEFQARCTREAYTNAEVSDALYATSGCTSTALEVLRHQKRGLMFQANGKWRWTAEEDKILSNGADARALKALEDKHGAFYFAQRTEFLLFMEESQ